MIFDIDDVNKEKSEENQEKLETSDNVESQVKEIFLEIPTVALGVEPTQEWGDEDEETEIHEDEVLKSPRLTSIQEFDMTHDTLLGQMEELREKINKMNSRIVELECSVGRVGYCLLQMSSLYPIFEGKSVASMSNSRGRNQQRFQSQKSGSGSVDQQGYYQVNHSQQNRRGGYLNGNRGGNGRGGGGRQRSGMNYNE